MRFDKPECPDCGELAKGTLEVVQGLALLNFEDENPTDGEAEYEGETEIDWNTQRSFPLPDSQVILECPNGHQWLSCVTKRKVKA